MLLWLGIGCILLLACTHGSASVSCNPACATDQDCIGGSCAPSPWYGVMCATNLDCPANTTCCGGSDESCDGTRLPSGDGASPQEFVVSADGLTVTDTITGLVWQNDVSSARTGCSGIGNFTCTWAEANAYCGGLSLGGLSGWRLPAVMELTTIVDVTKTSPAIDPTAFPKTPSTGWSFWTSSPDTSPWMSAPDAAPHPPLSSLARAVLFDDGSSGSDGVDNDNMVRCVRGSRCYPISRFVAVDGGLIRDTLTKLTWQQQASATIMGWSDAHAYCLSVGSGFRLPTVKELASIVDATVTSGATIKQDVFAKTPAGAFWTSSPYVGPPSAYVGSTGVWEIDFSSGFSYYDDVSNGSYGARVRCVR